LAVAQSPRVNLTTLPLIKSIAGITFIIITS
jgi:hypothetical protein